MQEMSQAGDDSIYAPRGRYVDDDLKLSLVPLTMKQFHCNMPQDNGENKVAPFSIRRIADEGRLCRSVPCLVRECHCQ